MLNRKKKSKKDDPYVTLLGLLGTGRTGLHLQEKSIECADAAFDKTNSFKNPATLLALKLELMETELV